VAMYKNKRLYVSGVISSLDDQVRTLINMFTIQNCFRSKFESTLDMSTSEMYRRDVNSNNYCHLTTNDFSNMSSIEVLCGTQVDVYKLPTTNISNTKL